MRLKPVGWRVYVRPHGGEEGVVVPGELKKLGFEVRMGMDENETRRNVLSLEMGWIVAVGPIAWMRQDMQGTRKPEEWEPWAKVGDQVIFGKYAGKLVRDPDQATYYMLMNDEDIQSVVEPAPEGAAEPEVSPEELAEVEKLIEEQGVQ